MRILNFGSLNIDEVFSVDSFVKPGQTISSDGFAQNCGGKGLNQTVAIARSGNEVFHAGAVGRNDNEMFMDLLSKDNVNTTFIDTDHSHSGKAFIQCDKNGQNCIVLNSGANNEITKNYIDKVLSNFEKGDIIVLQNEISNVDYIIDKSHENSMTICFNPSPVTPQLKKYPIEKVDYLILNEIEGEELTGEKDFNKIIAKLLKINENMKIILTLGEKGCIYGDSEVTLNQDIFNVKVADTTAAGDTFMGYTVGCICNGKDMTQTLKIASAASALAVTKNGAAVSIPHMKDVIEFIKS